MISDVRFTLWESNNLSKFSIICVYQRFNFLFKD